MRHLLHVIVLSSLCVPALAQAQAQDAGKSVFNGNCSTCHAVQPGVNKIGPSLYGVMGRPAGSLPGYHYSAAMKGVGKVWNQDTMAAFLQNPRGYVSGTKMSYPGLHQQDALNKIIPYLASLK
jgi:cytochrome c